MLRGRFAVAVLALPIGVMQPNSTLPGAVVKPSAQQGVLSPNAIVWGVVISDPNGMWNSSNPTRLTVTSSAGAGRYLISISFQSATAGATCALELFKNGASPSTIPLAAHDVSPWATSSKPGETLAAIDQAVVGDYYEIRLISAGLNGIQVDPVTRFSLQRVD
jgi:hypothetical protein